MTFSAYDIVISLPVIILALTVHEFSHALVADRLGDGTARRAGRLTLEPWVHLDPIGLVMIIFYRFGWAKPVPVNPHNMRDPAKGLALSALAGPVSNVIMAAVFALLMAFRLPRLVGPAISPHLSTMLTMGLVINASLAVFNLLPLPPLDGSRILTWVAPVDRWSWWPTVEAYGPFLLLLLLISGAGGWLISGPAQGLIRTLYAGAQSVARLFGGF